MIDSPGPSPTSLFSDGKYLWSIDSKLAKIYQHRMDDALTVIAEYKAPAGAPVGFFKDDQYAWVSDSQTRLLYKLRLDDQLSVLASYTVDDLEARQEPLSCFRWIDGDLWYARDRLQHHVPPQPPLAQARPHRKIIAAHKGWGQVQFPSTRIKIGPDPRCYAAAAMGNVSVTTVPSPTVLLKRGSAL